MSSSSLHKDSIDSGRSQFIGILLNWGLYGLLISQTSTYHTTFPHDTRINKTIAYFVLLLETAQTAVLTHGGYHTFVINAGDPDYLERVGLTWLAVPALSGTVGWIAALFYADRIYRISRSRKVSWIIVVLSFIQLAAAIMVGRQVRSVERFADLRQASEQNIHPIMWSASMTLCDIIIAVTMTYYLVQIRREFQSFHHLIRRLMLLAIETGTVTALAAIASGVLFAVWPESESFNIPGFILGKLYSNSLMRVLNSRNGMEYTGDVVSLSWGVNSGGNHMPRERCQTCGDEGRGF